MTYATTTIATERLQALVASEAALTLVIGRMRKDATGRLAVLIRDSDMEAIFEKADAIASEAISTAK